MGKEKNLTDLIGKVENFAHDMQDSSMQLLEVLHEKEIV